MKYLIIPAYVYKPTQEWVYQVRQGNAQGHIVFAGSHNECIEYVLKKMHLFDWVSDSNLPFIYVLNLHWQHFVIGLADYLGDGSTLKSRLGWRFYWWLSKPRARKAS